VARAQAGNLIEDVNSAVHVDTAKLQGYRPGFAEHQARGHPARARPQDAALAKNAVTAKYDNSTNPSGSR
jgi:hypothetical protein